MASTPEGRRLTEQHRQAQLGLRAEFLAQFLVLWQLLDSQRLDETSPAWVAAALRLIRPFRQRSAELSTGYFIEFREVELPRPGRPGRPGRPAPQPATPRPSSRQSAPRPTPRPASRPSAPGRQTRIDIPDIPPRPERRVRIEIPDLPAASERRTRVEIPEIDWGPADRAVVVSLNVTGPVGQKAKAARGKPLQVARDESFVEAAGAASRHMLNGGRQSLMRIVEADERMIGYIRVTDSDPCAFCAMLASRGPVYPTKSRAGRASNASLGQHRKRDQRLFVGAGEFKVHDNCACTIEPVTTKDTQWPGRAREFRKLWDDHVKGNFSGEEAINAFRREYERRQRAARRVEVA